MSSLVQVAPQEPLIDRFGRVHSNLRISVTDRCNIRCFYCMAEDAAGFTPNDRLLSFQQILRFVAVAAQLGVDKIRLTGGEPLLRPRLPELIEPLAAMAGIRDLALTTNAVLLEQHAGVLYAAGLRRLNIHLDTLDAQRFRTITRRDDLARVLRGIETALRTGFEAIKINAVAIKGLTEPDVIPLVRFGREHGIEVRFIEFMPLDAQEIWSLDRVLTADEMTGLLEQEFGPLTAVQDGDPRAPATEYRMADGYKVGFIASISRPFCLNCNRLRLTADGKLRYCLFATEETNVRRLLDGDDERLRAAIRETTWSKWRGHQVNGQGFQAPQRPMYSIGG